MSRDQRRYILILLLLVAAVGSVVVINRRDPLGSAAPAGGYEFVTDIDHWQRTERERAVTTPFDFNLAGDLTRIPLQLGAWTGVDVPQTNLEVAILLEPEQFVSRLYSLPDGRSLWLSLIGSRKSKSFHSPQICYDTDGWQTNASSDAIALREGEIYALRMLARKTFADGETAEQLVLYFYLWPSYARSLQEGMVLVEITAPVSGDADEALALARQFVGLLITSARE